MDRALIALMLLLAVGCGKQNTGDGKSRIVEMGRCMAADPSFSGRSGTWDISSLASVLAETTLGRCVRDALNAEPPATTQLGTSTGGPRATAMAQCFVRSSAFPRYGIWNPGYVTNFITLSDPYLSQCLRESLNSDPP